MLKKDQKYRPNTPMHRQAFQRMATLSNRMNNGETAKLRPGQLIVMSTKAVQDTYEAMHTAMSIKLDVHHDAALEKLMRDEDDNMLRKMLNIADGCDVDQAHAPLTEHGLPDITQSIFGRGFEDGPGEEDGPWAAGWNERSTTLGMQVKPRREVMDTKTEKFRREKPKPASKASSKKKQEKRLRQEIEYAVNYTDSVIDNMDVLTAIIARTKRLLTEMEAETWQLMRAGTKTLPELRHRYYAGALAELQRQQEQAERFNRWADEKEAQKTKAGGK